MHGQWCIGEYLPEPHSFLLFFSSLYNEVRVYGHLLVIHRAPSRYLHQRAWLGSVLQRGSSSTSVNRRDGTNIHDALRAEAVDVSCSARCATLYERVVRGASETAHSGLSVDCLPKAQVTALIPYVPIALT